MGTWACLASFCWVLAGCDGCGGSSLDRIQLEAIEVVAIDPNYFEDDTLADIEQGSVDLYAAIYVDDELYFSSTVNEDAQLPASLDMGGLGFLGIELQQTTRIVLFDEDVSTTEDYVGEVTVELGTLLEDEPARHTLTNGALEVALVLRW